MPSEKPTRITITLAPHLAETLRVAAFELRRTRPDLVREAIVKEYAKYAPKDSRP